jgi:hypothetical protein
MHVSSACFKRMFQAFYLFRCMLQMFHLHISRIDLVLHGASGGWTMAYYSRACCCYIGAPPWVTVQTPLRGEAGDWDLGFPVRARRRGSCVRTWAMVVGGMRPCGIGIGCVCGSSIRTRRLSEHQPFRLYY